MFDSDKCLEQVVANINRMFRALDGFPVVGYYPRGDISGDVRVLPADVFEGGQGLAGTSSRLPRLACLLQTKNRP